MAQGPSDTILVAIRITLRIRESKVLNPDPPDRRRFMLSEHSFLVRFLVLPMKYIYIYFILLLCQNSYVHDNKMVSISFNEMINVERCVSYRTKINITFRKPH